MYDQPTSFDCDRYLVIDDTDEDMTQLLTVICERSSQPAAIATDFAGDAS